MSSIYGIGRRAGPDPATSLPAMSIRFSPAEERGAARGRPSQALLSAVALSQRNFTVVVVEECAPFLAGTNPTRSLTLKGLCLPRARLVSGTFSETAL